MKRDLIDPSLSEALPYWDFFDDPFAYALLEDGSMSAGISCSLLDVECLDEGKINHITQRIRALLNGIPEHVSLQFRVHIHSDFRETLTKHEQGGSNVIPILIERIRDYRVRGLKDEITHELLYKPELRVFVRVPKVSREKNGIFSAFKKEEKFAAAFKTDFEETKETLFQSLEILQSGFDSLGITSQLLNKKELIEVVYRELNPKRSKIIPAPRMQKATDAQLEPDVIQSNPWLALDSPRSQLVFGDLVLGLEQFTLDSMYHRVLTLKTLPEITYAGQLAGFLRMPFQYELGLSLRVPEQATEMSKLQQKRKMAHSLAVTQSGQASDLESETKLSSTEELIRELLSSGQRIFEAQLSVTLKAESTPEGEKRLNRMVREVIARFRALNGAEGLQESVGAWKIKRNDLPLAPMRLERGKKFKTNNLADFVPIFAPRLGDEDPVVLFKNRLNGLVAYDPMSPKLPNYNCLVTGSSGAGKSFLNNCILLQELTRKMKVFIIDIGGSYRKITESLNGQYLDMNMEGSFQINPFALENPNEEPPSQKLKSLLAILECMVSEDDSPRLPKLTRALLQRDILELYSEKRSEGKVPTLSDLKEKLSKSEEAELKAISKMLFLWTGNRPYGRILDGYGKLRSDAQICAFDLKGLSSHPDLQSVMILILTDFILSQVESDRLHRKRIILDEAWELLKSPTAANFMEYCARTLRKTGSGITFITQGVEEIVASPIGSAILNNTATKFILLQRGDSKILAETLKLNSQELGLIESLEQRKGQYSEGFLIEGDERQVVRIVPSPYDYWLSTSDPKDNLFLSDQMKTGITLVEAIEKAVDQYPEGIAQGEKQIQNRRKEEQRNE